MTDDRKSPLANALAARKQKAHPFVVNGVFGLGGKPIHKVHLRVPTNDQKERAVAAARNRLRERANGDEGLLDDPDVSNDAKSRELLQLVTTDEADQIQAFYGGDWMARNMTDDQIGQLLNLLNEVRRKDGPISWDLSDVRVESIVDLCVRASNSEIPERVLSNYQREFLTSLVVLLSLKLYEARKPGVQVVEDGDGGFQLKWPEGEGPDFEPLAPDMIHSPEQLEALTDALEDMAPEGDDRA
jgi:hypothetical protein